MKIEAAAPEIALYCPDIPQNAGAAMRLCAGLDLGLHIIEPCGFIWDDRKIKRAGMDYIAHVRLTRHESWGAFQTYMSEKKKRLILMTTKAAQPYTEFAFSTDDIIMAGQESCGVPDFVHDAAQARIVIPMKNGLRSLNVVNAASMIAGEALRQTIWADER